MYENCKISNIYVRRHGHKKSLRAVIHIVFPDGKKYTTAYARYVMECHIGRRLTLDETVDHIDRNTLNNNIDNLRILDRTEHSRIDSIRRLPQVFICPICLQKFALSPKQLGYRVRGARSLKRDMAGPFCSHSCSAKYSNKLRAGHCSYIRGSEIKDAQLHKYLDSTT